MESGIVCLLVGRSGGFGHDGFKFRDLVLLQQDPAKLRWHGRIVRNFNRAYFAAWIDLVSPTPTEGLLEVVARSDHHSEKLASLRQITVTKTQPIHRLILSGSGGDELWKFDREPLPRRFRASHVVISVNHLRVVGDNEIALFIVKVTFAKEGSAILPAILFEFDCHLRGPLWVGRGETIRLGQIVRQGIFSVDAGEIASYCPAMANDLHIFLSEEEFAQIRAIAKREDRSASNLARVYIRRALAADSLDDAPISPRKTLDVVLGRAVPVEDCVTTDEPGKAGGKR